MDCTTVDGSWWMVVNGGPQETVPMPLARSFRELNVYQKMRNEVCGIFRLTRTFPREERYSLIDQIRRSSRSAKSQLAEAWARRRYPAAFIDKLTAAQGEAMETQSWLDDALDCGYIDAQAHRERDEAWQHIGAMLGRMIEEADRFCHTVWLRE